MKNLRSLIPYFLRYKKLLIWGILFIILSNLANTYIPVVIKEAVNALETNHNMNVILGYAGMVVLVSIVGGVFRYYIRQTIIVMSREIEFDVRQDFWTHLLRLPLRYFKDTPTGTIMAHATNDISAVRMFIGPAVMYSIDTILRLGLSVTIMIQISPTVTLAALAPLPFLSILVYYVGKKVHTRFTLIQEKFAELTTKAQENFSGIRVIKSYVKEESEIEEFSALSKEYLQRNMKLVKIQALFQPLLFLLTGFSVIIVVFLGGMKVIQGELSLGDMTALIIYLNILIWPMIAFGWVINIVQQAEASMNRINKILSEPIDIADSDATDYSIKELTGSVEFKNVSFSYKPNSPKVLDSISFSIPKGSTVAIMGATGSGKSTLISLISRLYDATEGTVLLDGKPITTIPLATVRTTIGLVQQEALLFSTTIRNNLTYGLKEHNEELMLKCSAIAQFDKDVQEFPQGYDTIIGERGITMSGGQKQRASLARALTIDPKILILDDSFSAVDTHTEEEILKNLKNFMRERTSILISHRVSTVKDADTIIVLENGQIAEKGTHDELIAIKGLYNDIYTKQLLEKELEEAE